MSLTLPLSLLLKYRTNIFVETGSFRGDGIVKALWANFLHIYSIESFEYYYNECLYRFSTLPQVKLFYGLSEEILYSVIKNIPFPITFWLDAHTNNYSPILKELEQINLHPIKNHILLIDDIRLFDNKTFFPPINKITETILKINPEYKLFMEDSLLYPEDILVACL